MRFSNQQKIYITNEIKKEIDKVVKKPLSNREKLIMCAIADAIINLPAEE